MTKGGQFPVIIAASGEQRRLLPSTPGKVTLEEAQAVVGGYVELIPLYPGWILLCNENGRYENLPRNDVATEKFAPSLNPGDYLCGDVIVCPTSFFE